MANPQRKNIFLTNLCHSASLTFKQFNKNFFAKPIQIYHFTTSLQVITLSMNWIWYYFNFLELNLVKNVSNAPAFLWQNQIQTIEYGLNDKIWIKKWKKLFYSFQPSYKNFRAILMPKMILAKFLSQKTGLLEPFLSFKSSML